jgi:hypothetical protein
MQRLVSKLPQSSIQGSLLNHLAHSTFFRDYKSREVEGFIPALRYGKDYDYDYDDNEHDDSTKNMNPNNTFQRIEPMEIGVAHIPSCTRTSAACVEDFADQISPNSSEFLELVLQDRVFPGGIGKSANAQEQALEEEHHTKMASSCSALHEVVNTRVGELRGPLQSVPPVEGCTPRLTAMLNIVASKVMQEVGEEQRKVSKMHVFGASGGSLVQLGVMLQPKRCTGIFLDEDSQPVDALDKVRQYLWATSAELRDRLPPDQETLTSFEWQSESFALPVFDDATDDETDTGGGDAMDEEKETGINIAVFLPFPTTADSNGRKLRGLRNSQVTFASGLTPNSLLITCPGVLQSTEVLSDTNGLRVLEVTDEEVDARMEKTAVAVQRLKARIQAPRQRSYPTNKRSRSRTPRASSSSGTPRSRAARSGSTPRSSRPRAAGAAAAASSSATAKRARTSTGGQQFHTPPPRTKGVDIDSLAAVASAFMIADERRLICNGADACDGGCTIGSSVVCSQLKFNMSLIAMAADVQLELSSAPPQPFHLPTLQYMQPQFMLKNKRSAWPSAS